MGFPLKLNTLRPKKKAKDFFDFFNGRNANIRKTQGHKEEFLQKKWTKYAQEQRNSPVRRL